METEKRIGRELGATSRAGLARGNAGVIGEHRVLLNLQRNQGMRIYPRSSLGLSNRRISSKASMAQTRTPQTHSSIALDPEGEWRVNVPSGERANTRALARSPSEQGSALPAGQARQAMVSAHCGNVVEASAAAPNLCPRRRSKLAACERGGQLEPAKGQRRASSVRAMNDKRPIYSPKAGYALRGRHVGEFPGKGYGPPTLGALRRIVGRPRR